MKGGNPNKFGVKKLTLYLVALLCLSLAIWAWEKVPLLTTFLPPPEQFDSLFSMHSPVIPAITQTTTNLQLSTMNVPSDSLTKDVPLHMSKKEGPSQSADDGSFSVIARIAKKENFSVTSSSRSQERLGTQPIAPKHRSSSEQTKDADKLNTIPTENKECNYAKGKWVADSRRPLYSGFDCKQFLSSAWSCRLTKRTDFSFEKFRWQPQGCQMPEFEGSDFLKRMQHKTIAFVGDSLGRQQFQSLMCMVTGGRENLEIKDVGGEYGLALKPGAKRPDGWVYRFPQTNTTILYYWSASLCELEPMNKTNPATTYALHLDRPATFIKQNLDKFEVLVLNTGHHWNKGKFAANRWVVHANGKPVADGNLEIAKNHTVHSVVKWLDARLTERPRGLNVFFRTLSPRHFANGDWNTGGSCDSTKPLSGGSEVKRDGSADPVAEDAVKGTRVKLLDITALSQLRDEGHMSNSVNPKGGYDCLHWCLPGIPDTWNEILAARI